MKGIITVLVIAVFLAVLIPVALSCAPKEFPVSGTLELTQQNMDPNPITENGKMTYEKSTSSYDVHGTLEGTTVSEFTTVVDTMTGKVTMEGQGTFTGKVKGKSGSYVYHFVSNGQFTSPTSGVYTSDVTITSGTGGLSSLRGTLHTENRAVNNVDTGTYSGTYRFEK